VTLRAPFVVLSAVNVKVPRTPVGDELVITINRPDSMRDVPRPCVRLDRIYVYTSITSVFTEVPA
jgi:hypothetical protein